MLADMPVDFPELQVGLPTRWDFVKDLASICSGRHRRRSIRISKSFLDPMQSDRSLPQLEMNLGSSSQRTLNLNLAYSLSRADSQSW